MELENKKVAIFLANLFEDVELTYPYYRMKEAGAEVHLLGKEKDATYSGKHGVTMKSCCSIKTENPDDYDFLIIPGGYGPDQMRMEPKFIEFTKKMVESGKIVAAVCHGPWLLASAEVIDGKTVTSWPSLRDDLRHAGAKVVDKEVVVDGNIITSRMPEDLPAFCRTIIHEVTARQPVGARR